MGLSEKEIQKLVFLARQGSSHCVGKLYDFFNQRIFRFILYRVKTIEIAEDLTQTVFLEMIRSLDRYKVRENTKFSTWLFQIARFRLIDYYRQQKNTIPIENVREDSNENLHVDPINVLFDTRAKKVWEKIEELSEKYQTVLHLVYVEEMDIIEIAGVLNTTTLNVRVLKFRALNKLRSALER